MMSAAAASEPIAIATAAKPDFAVCADPSNLPYSDDKQAGFENKIATLIAADFHADLRYVWNEQRRNFFRHTLLAGRCDVVISVPAAFAPVLTTRPYFTSSYVFVTRSSDKLKPVSFDDPALRTARIGLQLIGAEGANTPPAMVLARRGITDRITGFPMWADDDVVNPQGKIVDAVAAGDIDVAIVWGPFGGFFAHAHGDALHVQQITSDPKTPELPFVFAMAMGVRKGDTALRDRLQKALDRHQPEIAAILHSYAIPLVADAAPSAGIGADKISLHFTHN